jgi:hypothetical protein
MSYGQLRNPVLFLYDKLIVDLKPEIMTRYHRLIILLLLSFLITNCEKKVDTIDHLCPDFKVYYFSGSGWTGSQFRVSIQYPDTLLIYERQYNPLSLERKSKYTINKNEIDSLFRDIIILKDIKLKNYYGFGPNKPTDLPSTFLKYNLCNRIDSSTLYSPDVNEVPIELLKFIGRIRIIVNNHDTINLNAR